MAITTSTGTVFAVTSKATGKVSWCAEIVVAHKSNGTPVKTRRSFATKAQATKGLHSLISEREHGHLTVVRNESLEQFSIRWIREVKANQVRKSTLNDYEYKLRKYVFPYLGARQLRSITGRDIDSWMSQMRREGKSSNTIKGARRVIFGVFKNAYRQELISRNPVEQTDAPKRQASEKSRVQEPWTEQEVIKALEQSRMMDDSSKDVELFLCLAIYLGMRRGEILGLKWSDIDFDTRRLQVNRTLKEQRTSTRTGKGVIELVTDDPKTRSSARTLPIVPTVIEALERQMMRQSIARMQNPDLWQEQEWVFTTKTGTAIYPSNMSYRYKQFIKRNKLRHIRIHDLRHTSAVLALTSGMPLEAVSQGLGHSRLDITKDVYAPHVPKLNEDFGFGLAAYIQSQRPMNVPSPLDQEVPRNF
jgi:integrase